MPNLLLFVPCDKVIIDERTHTLSLISVFENIELPIPPPEGSVEFVLPLQWSIVTLWQRAAEEEDRKRFEERCEVLAPDGSLKFEVRAEFGLDKPSARNIKQMFGFPALRGGGTYRIKLFLRELSEGAKEELIATYPLTLKFATEPK